MRLFLALLVSMPAAALNISDTLLEIKRACLKPCEFSFESATQNEIGKNEYMWAFAYTVDKKRVITHRREKDGQFSPLGGEEFHRLALNPKSLVVARYLPQFLIDGGQLPYSLPENLKTEGMSPASTAKISLAGKAALQVEVLTLEDKANSWIEIRTLSPTEFELKTARRFKGEQPAFKVVAKVTKYAEPVLQLAIPFKPQPNRMLFGVVGFLFGGLIAVMVLMSKRRQPKKPV